MNYTYSTRTKTKRKGGAGKTAAKVVAFILVLLIVAGVACGVGWFLLKEKKANALAVTIDGIVYTQDHEGLFIYPETEITVSSQRGVSDYTVKITATSKWKDFAYTVGAEPYQWNNMDGADFTECFKLKKTTEGFILSYESVQAVIAGYYAYPVNLPEDLDLTGNLFNMEISSANRTLTFAFGLGVTATGIAFDRTEIVI